MRRLAGLGAATLVVLVLVVAQIVLPGIAEQRLRDQLARSGQVLSVHVHAVPAIELLWHHAGSVDIRLRSYRPGPGRLGADLERTADVGSLHASTQQLDDGLLTLHDATLVKRNDTLVGTATVQESELRSALPFLSSVTPVASASGQLTLQATAFGLSVDLTVSAQEGRLVVAPDVPFGGLATITLFSDPHVAVQSVSAAAVPGGFTLRATARLH